MHLLDISMTTCIEQKFLLCGECHEYRCELVHFTSAFGILRYIIDREYRIGRITLKPGEATLAFYWTYRPYTLYTWRHSSAGPGLYYFNIADRVSLSPTRFAWRDLVVDILVSENELPHILDEKDLPSNLNSELFDYIELSKQHILMHYRRTIEEVKYYTSDGFAGP
jgi:predicted RNA-binding protein associated with RNAse of E/G family